MAQDSLLAMAGGTAVAAGINGVPQPGAFGDMTTVTFSPNIGIILAVAGCGAAFVAAIRSVHHRQD